MDEKMMDEKNEKAIADGNSDRSTNSSTDFNNDLLITNRHQRLLQEVGKLPPAYALVAVGNKKNPLGDNWQNTPLQEQDFEDAVKVGHFERLPSTSKEGDLYCPSINWWFAIGVLCGTPSGGLLFVDHDGESCDALIEKLSGQPLTEALPKTPTVTSGRPGRFQSIYWVPERYWGAISTRKISTEIKGEDGTVEQLEFRWDGCQSVVAGYHPITGQYDWVDGLSLQDCEVAEVPLWVVDQMMREFHSNQPTQVGESQQNSFQHWNEIDWAQSYLAAIPHTEDYDLWINVGMALHSVSESLLLDWDNWSKGASNYETGACEKHWKSFNADGGLKIGFLGLLAKEHGWESPFKRKGSERPVLTVDLGKVDHRASFSESTREDLEELSGEVQSLVELMEETAPIQSLLHQKLVDALTHRAKQFNVPVEAFLTVLLSISASLLKIGTFLEINASTEYRCPPILWGGLVGDSGSTKSPILKSLLKPLVDFQSEADQVFRAAFAQYEENLRDWKNSPKDKRESQPCPPVPREYHLQDVTLEATYDCLDKQSNNGLLLAVDELAGLLKGFNQYRAGEKGNDRQRMLSLYDGGPLKVNRRNGSRISLSQTSLSLVGTIQPCVLRKFMHDLQDVDGFWSRFFWVPIPLTQMPSLYGSKGDHLASLLQRLYRGLIDLNPVIYQFDKSGQEIWEQWHYWCEHQKVNEPNDAFRAVYPKSKERAARIALVLHCINAVIEGKLPDAVIPGSLLESAITFTKWLIGQTRLIYADAGAITSKEAAKISRFINRSKGAGWMGARDVTHRLSPKPNALEARVFMEKVVALGYAIDNGETERKYKIKIKDDPGNTSNNQSPKLGRTGFEAGNNSGNNSGNKLVTADFCPLNTSLEVGFDEIDSNKPSDPEETKGGFVTNGFTSPISATSSTSERVQVELLPEVLDIVTALEPLLDKDSTQVCCQVTSPNFQVGDRVRYIGQKYAHLLQGLDLKIHRIQGCQADCKKPDGSFTTWIDQEDLEYAR